VVTAPKTSKNSDITLILAPVRYPQVSYTRFILAVVKTRRKD